MMTITLAMMSTASAVLKRCDAVLGGASSSNNTLRRRRSDGSRFCNTWRPLRESSHTLYFGYVTQF
jgi:hypothetical protein